MHLALEMNSTDLQ